MRCRVLPLIDRGRYTCTHGFEVDSTCQFTCDTGYRIEGQHSRMCQHSGSWSGGQPECSGNAACLHRTFSSIIYVMFFFNGSGPLSNRMASLSNFFLSLPQAVMLTISLTTLAVRSSVSHSTCKHHFLPLHYLALIQRFSQPLSCAGCDSHCRAFWKHLCHFNRRFSFLTAHLCDRLFISDTDPPKIKCPPSRLKAAEPGKLTAMVTWNPPVATDTADKSLK